MNKLEREKRILHLEDVEGEDYEFEVFLTVEERNDISKLYEIGRKLLIEHHQNYNDITNINVLTLN